MRAWISLVFAITGVTLLAHGVFASHVLQVTSGCFFLISGAGVFFAPPAKDHYRRVLERQPRSASDMERNAGVLEVVMSTVTRFVWWIVSLF